MITADDWNDLADELRTREAEGEKLPDFRWPGSPQEDKTPQQETQEVADHEAGYASDRSKAED